MKKAAPFLALLTLGAAQPSSRTSIEGLWKNPIGSAIISVAPCGNALCGKVVWASSRGQREVEKTTSHVVGTTVLTGVKPKGNGWTGKLFIPDDNVHVTAKLSVIGSRQLKLTGCAMAGLFCRSQIWTRTDELPPQSD